MVCWAKNVPFAGPPTAYTEDPATPTCAPVHTEVGSTTLSSQLAPAPPRARKTSVLSARKKSVLSARGGGIGSACRVPVVLFLREVVIPSSGASTLMFVVVLPQSDATWVLGHSGWQGAEGLGVCKVARGASWAPGGCARARRDGLFGLRVCMVDTAQKKVRLCLRESQRSRSVNGWVARPSFQRYKGL